MKVTYLCLRIFGGGGGLENFNRNLVKALSELSVERGFRLNAVSVYDSARDVDARCCDPGVFKCMEGRKRVFALSAMVDALGADVLFVAHVNLAPVALFCKALNPRLKLVTMAYGIDVWGRLGRAKLELLRRSDRVYAISRYTRDRMVKAQGIAGENVEILPVTIDPYLTFHAPDPGFRSRVGISEATKVLLTVARLSATERYKGYDRVIRALPLIRARFPDVRYVVVGKGEPEEVARVERVVAETGMTDFVELRGYVPDEELVNYYGAADLFVMPSTGEGFGIVFLEALLHGKPVVAGNRDGSVDAVADGQLGMLVDPDDVDAIAAAVNDMLAGNVTSHLVDGEFLRRKVNEMFGFDAFKQRLAEGLGRYFQGAYAARSNRNRGGDGEGYL